MSKTFSSDWSLCRVKASTWNRPVTFYILTMAILMWDFLKNSSLKRSLLWFLICVFRKNFPRKFQEGGWVRSPLLKFTRKVLGPKSVYDPCHWPNLEQNHDFSLSGQIPSESGFDPYTYWQGIAVMAIWI